VNRRHLRVTFTESVDPATAVELTNYHCTETDSDTSLGILAATRRDMAEIDLTTSLQSSVLYTLTADGIADISGNEMGIQRVAFRGSETPDTHPPRMTEVRPPSGSVSLVPDSAIIVRFSEAMDTLSITRNSGLLPRGGVEVVWDDPMTEFRFSLGALAPGNVYTLYLRDGCSDLDGNRMQEWHFFTFTPDSMMPSGDITFYIDGPEGERTVVALFNDILEIVRVQVSEDPVVRMKWLVPANYTALAGVDLDGDRRFDLTSHGDARAESTAVSTRLYLKEERERLRIFDRLEAFFGAGSDAGEFD
jgi:hypothetical protein